MMSALFAREAEEGRLNASDAESFHSITCAEGQSRAQLSRRIRKVLLDAGALDTSDPSYVNHARALPAPRAPSP